MLGADVSEPVPQPDHGVTTVFITLPNTKIELIAPLGENSPIAKFLERIPDGGIHHVCYEVDDIRAARDRLRARRRACARRRRAEDRRARQAGAVPAPEGFLRHADRDRAGVRTHPQKNCGPWGVAASRNHKADRCVGLGDGVRGLSIRNTVAGRSARAFLAFLTDVCVFNIGLRRSIAPHARDLIFTLIRETDQATAPCR